MMSHKAALTIAMMTSHNNTRATGAFGMKLVSHSKKRPIGFSMSSTQ